MRLALRSAGIAVGLVCSASFAQPLDSSVPDPPNPHFYYQLDRELTGYSDKLLLRTGELRLGKVQEWGTLVYFWDKYTGQRYAYKRDEVTNFEVIRSNELKQKPNLPDLTVGFIERTPRDQGWHNFVKYDLEGKHGLGVLMVDPEKYQLHPKPGQEVTFAVHVLNAGLAPSQPFQYEVRMDDEVLHTGRIAHPIEAGQQELVSVPWRWQDGQHYITVKLDTQNENKEIAKWNNTFIDPVRALTFFFAVSRSTYDGFSKAPNLADTFNFEDWAQYHVHMMNWLFEHSVYPSAPQGILERVRIDSLIVVDDSRDPDEQKKWDPVRRHNHDVNDIIEYNGNWEFGTVNSPEDAARWAAQADWGLPHELGHQLGLVDLYWMNHGARDVLVKNRDGNYQNVSHFYPWPATMMHWHGPHLFSEICAGYLNHTLGRPRGFFGDYYYQIPKRNLVRVYSNTGRPIEGVEISLYQRWTDPENTFIKGDWKCPWAYGPDPLFAGRTGPDGIFVLPNQKVTPHDTPWGYQLRDNPWGQINVVGDNVLLLAKLNYRDQEAFHWLRLHDANVGYLRGHTDEFAFDLHTRFAAASAPQPPQELKPIFEVRTPNDIGLALTWKPSSSPDIVEYRSYHRTSHGDQSVKPYRLFNVVGADKVRDGAYAVGAEYWKDLRPDQGFYGTDSYLAVTAVDAKGNESALSNVIYIPNWSAHNVIVDKVAVGAAGKFYISINAGETQMLTWDEQRGLGEMGFRDIAVPHAFPRFGGIAVDSRNRIAGTHPEACQIGLWDTGGDRVKLIGKKGAGPGEFNSPSDLAIDSKGRVYVADTGNHRIQMFDAELTHLSTFGTQGNGEAQFEDPVALGIVKDKLAVTDRKLSRVLVFDVSGDPPRQVLEIPKVNWGADRGLLAPSGNLYVTDGAAVVIYKPDGTVLQKIEQTAAGRVFQPRGLCAGAGGSAYFVNALPFANVLKIELK